MPKTKFQEVIFTILMVMVMVYAMVVYNIASGLSRVSYYGDRRFYPGTVRSGPDRSRAGFPYRNTR